MATTDQRDTGSTTASTSCPSEPSLKDTQRQEASIDKDNVPSPSYPLAEDAFAALLLRVPPHRLISVLEAEHGTLDTRVQDALASAVQQPLFGPLSHGTYAKRVLDAVLRRVMARGGDVSDFFADVITSWAGGDNPSVVPPPGVEREGMLWRTLTWLPEKGSGACEHVHVLASEDMLAGNTGCFLWPASLVLCSFLLGDPGLVRGKTCVSLGSGAGLDAMVCRRMGAGAVVLVDCSSDAMDGAQASMDANGIAWEIMEPQSDLTGLGERNYCMEADFEDLTFELPSGSMLLGSDIVYDPGLARCLARLLDRLFRGNEGKGIRALIATALRTKETFDVFLDNLRVSEALRFSVREADHSRFLGSHALFSTDTHGKFVIVEIDSLR